MWSIQYRTKECVDLFKTHLPPTQIVWDNKDAASITAQVACREYLWCSLISCASKSEICFLTIAFPLSVCKVFSKTAYRILLEQSFLCIINWEFFELFWMFQLFLLAIKKMKPLLSALDKLLLFSEFFDLKNATNAMTCSLWYREMLRQLLMLIHLMLRRYVFKALTINQCYLTDKRK